MKLPLPLPNILWHAADHRAEVQLSDQTDRPGPYAYLLAALAAYTAQALRTFADERGWNLRTVELGYLESDSGDGSLRRQIRFDGNLSQNAVDKLLTLAEACPVHRQLTSKITVRSSLLGTQP
jgi:putative redox protein